MKKLLTILIGCSLACSVGAMAQQDDDSVSGKKKKKEQQNQQDATQQSPAGTGQSRANQQGRSYPGARQKNESRPKQNGEASRQEHPTQAGPRRNRDAASKERPEAPVETGRQDNSATNANGPARTNGGNKTRSADRATTSTREDTSASTLSHSGNAGPGSKPANAKAKKPDPQVVQRVKTEHANFKAQPKPDKVPAVTFNQSYQISGARQWQGRQYEVFRAYRPAWHDQGWYRAHYPRVEIIAGGAYYFNNGYWFPAWGYDPSYQYYAFDAPIYVGSQALPPDRVIADVQAVLQQQGYYKGEVDGLLGPLTRDALTQYQNDNGLYATAIIDEPTLQSLGLS